MNYQKIWKDLEGTVDAFARQQIEFIESLGNSAERNAMLTAFRLVQKAMVDIVGTAEAELERGDHGA